MRKAFRHIAGKKLLALIDDCQSVDEQIAKRKLAQLKEIAEAFRTMPKVYFIGVATYFASGVTLLYALLASYISLAIVVGRAIGIWVFIAGVVLFILLAVASSGVTTGKTYSLRLFLSLWFALLLSHFVVTVWLLFVPFSSVKLAFWSLSLLFLWLARKIMNGTELTMLMKWRVSLKIAQFRRLALTQPKHK